MPNSLTGEEKEKYVSGLFGAAAPKYDLLNSIISLGSHRRWRRAAVAMSGLAPGGAALDVATGTGDFALELARVVGEVGLVVGADFCLPMLELGRRKIAGTAGVCLLAGNAQRLPFAAACFDCVTIGFALRNVASVPAAVAEMVRVIRPGGRVISLEILGPRSGALAPLWRLYFFRVMPRVARLFGGEREPYDYLPDSVAGFCSREELADIFRQCGLVDVQVQDMALGTVCIHTGTKK